MAKYLGTWVLSHVAFEFRGSGIVKHGPFPNPLIKRDSRAEGRAEGRGQSRGQSRAEPHLIAFGLASNEVGMSLSCFLRGYCPGGAHRVPAPAEPEVQWIRRSISTYRQMDRQRDAARPPKDLLGCTCQVLSCPLVSKFLGCRPWVVSQLHSCPYRAFLAATAYQRSVANMLQTDAPTRQTARAHTPTSCDGKRPLVMIMVCRPELPIETVRNKRSTLCARKPEGGRVSGI